MTMYKPTLIIRRLRVERLSHVVYDEKFHLGVNILQGDNSSGKSTILNFIYYSIGGDISEWSEIALLCSRVLVQVSLNGHTATLAREVSNKSGQPMEIFSGTMEEAMKAGAALWDKYPYRRSDARESFSQALFRVLEIPEASNEASGNITIHQILRLMYADQLSPIGTLFKFEQFDPPTLRDAVGRLVFGAYDDELYTNRLLLRELEAEFACVSAELTGIYNLIGVSGEVLTTEWVAAELVRLNEEQRINDADIASAERNLYEAGKVEKLSLQAQQRAYEEVQKLQGEISLLQEKIDAAKFEISDADEFIRDLESKLVSLQESSKTSDSFGRVTFQYCPACFSAVESDQPTHSCHLCKSPFDGERAKTRIISLINDTGRQLKQSRGLQGQRAKELDEAVQREFDLQKRWRAASEALARSIRTPTSEAREQLRKLQRKAGYIERQREDLARKEQLSEALDKLVATKADLNSRITTINSKNEQLISALANRLRISYEEVESEIVRLLRADLPRENAFIHAKTVQFGFADNKLSVDNQSYFSASSRVILRNSFFLGLFSASTKYMSFRHLRLSIFDSIEDKGMQPERSHNFQRQILQISNNADCEHQIIFATSMIAPELDKPDYTVGHYSTLGQHTLSLGGAQPN